MICKQCGKKSESGHKFCNKKCRKAWIKVHNFKGAKTHFTKRDYLLDFGITGRGAVSNEIGADEHCIL